MSPLGLAFAALFIAAACKPAPAQAQTAKLFSVQVGIGDQMTSKARRQVGSDSLHVGASLNFGNGSTLFVLPGTQSADFDYNYASAHGGRLNAYSLMYANRVYLVPHLAQSIVHHVVPYVGFGIGAIDTEVRRHYMGDGHTSGSKTNLRRQADAGRRFAEQPVRRRLVYPCGGVRRRRAPGQLGYRGRPAFLNCGTR